MRFAVVMTRRQDGSYEATWLTTHLTNGLDAAGESPWAALRELADRLEETEARRVELPD